MKNAVTGVGWVVLYVFFAVAPLAIVALANPPHGRPFVVEFSVALGFVAAGLARARRWSRTPALLTQLFTGIVGVYLVQGHRYSWGIPALLLGATAFVAQLLPASVRALAAGRPAPPPGTVR